MKEAVFIAWARYQRRSELLAQYLGATIKFVNFGQSRKILQAPVRYLVQTWQTWHILRKKRPNVVFVQNPPIIAVLIVALYTRCFGARYVIDSHTAAFISSKWRWSVGLHRLLSHWALTTIVHNESQQRLIQRWGCPYFVLAFTPGDYPGGGPYPLSEKFNVAVICSFDADEPLDILFEAAGQLNEVCFYLTGDAKLIDRRLLMKKPENIYLTGYLSYKRYVGLLRGVSAIMDLVNNEHTLLMGAFEAVSLGVPLIVSDWPLLRNYFSLGTVHIPNTVEGVCEGVRRTQHELPQLRRDILLLREQFQVEWMQKLRELKHLLGEN
jgi:glycosyltransferase involved in cell wall biosynthesis